MVGEPERVARAQQQHRPPVEHHARALRSGDHPHALVQAELIELVQAVLEIQHPRSSLGRLRPGCRVGSGRKVRRGPDGSAPVPLGGRFSMNARTPSAKSSERNAASRSACSSASSAGSSGGISACSTRLLPRSDSGESAAISRGQRDRRARRASVDDLVDEAPAQRLAGVDRPRGQEQLARAGGADRVHEAAQPGVRVDDAEPRRRHPEPGARRADPQVAGERELQPAAERVAVQGRDHRAPAPRPAPPAPPRTGA